ncbi:phosphopantetheine-binding protein [Neomegalonema sp.]|uniref:phosphopantetheine-binding protein n=1 Tax=Neomegalonema sp. TaxID=2039713 RepID=UPI002620BC98|nr:phosphopantetheine-binding protein [Neomegalonema sp.]MDD2868683.1 phosphopantetheine-binding protein [Neomegalonema sp.]
MALTLERMRADVAAKIHEEPDAVSDHENLMDLGLDSMRLMELTLLWRELGTAAGFAEFAEKSTLAEWWALVQARPKAA